MAAPFYSGGDRARPIENVRHGPGGPRMSSAGTMTRGTHEALELTDGGISNLGLDPDGARPPRGFGAGWAFARQRTRALA